LVSDLAGVTFGLVFAAPPVVLGIIILFAARIARRHAATTNV
jgi:hypothetical protein